MFARDFNDILNEYLTHINNLAPVEQFDVDSFKNDHPDLHASYVRLCKPDTSIGSVLFLRASAFSSMYWGLLKALDALLDQFFHLSATRKNKERIATEFGILSIANMSDSELDSAISDVKQARQMGGNHYDYEAWAKEVVVPLVKVDPVSASNAGFASFDFEACFDDNDAVIAWSTDGISSGSSITFDSVNFVRSYVKLALYASAAGLTTVYNVQYSDDNIDYQTATKITPVNAGLNDVTWTSVGAHRYWRLVLETELESGPFITEVKFYEGPERVDGVKVYPLAQGEGTFDVVISSNLSYGESSQDLIDTTETMLNDRRPVLSGFDWGLRVVGPTVMFQNISIVGSGSNWDRVKTKEDLMYYLNSLQVGQTLYRSQLVAIAIQNGADTAVCNTPSADISPTVNQTTGIYGLIRSGVVTVS